MVQESESRAVVLIVILKVVSLKYRCVLGDGPPQFREYFQMDRGHSSGISTRLAEDKHCRQLKEPRVSSSTDIMKRSILGLIAVYNMLPEEVVMSDTVQDFQSLLQELVKLRALAQCDNWKLSLSPRVPLQHHPLR